MKILSALILIPVCIIMLAASCKKTQKPIESPEATTESGPSVEETLLVTYRKGEIDKCALAGAVVYRCQRSIHDAETRIYDAKGTQIATCFYSVNKVDPACKETTDCKTIYRVEGNIWGKPAVNEIEK